jgi:hypothetical protein
MRLRQIVAVGVALGALWPTSAQAQVTFGADLNQAPNVAIDCTQVPFTNFTYASGFTTCTWAAFGRFMNPAEAFTVPSGTGVITAARVRTGQFVGPMRIDVFSSLRDPLSTIPICCKQVANSAVFTPAPNSITTIPLNLPVINGPTVTGVLEFNTLALTVLAPGTAVPLHDTGDYDTLSGPSAGAMYPAINPGQERSDIAGTFGYQVLMNMDWVPTSAPGAPVGGSDLPGAGGGGGGGGGVATGTPIAVPVVSLGATRVPIRANAALIELLCAQGTPCSGVMRLQNRAVVAGTPRLHGAATRTYASRKFTIQPGKTRRIKAKLGRVGRSALKKRKRVAAYVNLDMGGTRMTLGRVTLTRR